jgi:hypothetical protein
MAYTLPDEIEGYKKPEDNDYNAFESALAGVATGLWNIPKGFVSLGSQIYDLVGDTNSSAEIEKWFDDVNPFHEAAESQTIGKITKVLAQTIPPIGRFSKIGASVGASIGLEAQAAKLAKQALEAKKAGNYFSLNNIGSKIIGNTGALVGAGVGGALVADEDIGTFADMLRGTSLEPYAITMMNTDSKEGRQEAARKLLNRIKFGTEISLFDLGLAGAGTVLGKLREPSTTGLTEYSSNPLLRGFQKFFTYGLKPAGTGTIDILEAKGEYLSAVKDTEYLAAKATVDFNNSIGNIWDKVEKNYINTKGGIAQPEEAKRKFLDKIYDVISPSYKEGEESLLKESSREKINLTEVTEGGLKKLKFEVSPIKSKDLDKSIFTVNDYELTPKLKEIIDEIEKVGGNAIPLKDAILNYRLMIDNMSLELLRKGMPEELAQTLKNQLGSYLTTKYKKVEGLSPILKYPVTEEQRQVSLKRLINQRTYEQLNKLPKGSVLSLEEQNNIIKKSNEEIENYIKKRSTNEIDPKDPNFKNGVSTVLDKPTRAEVESITVNPSILKPKILDPWQEELEGIIKDPTYTFLNTVSKQSNLNSFLRYTERINEMGSKGANKFIFDPSELSVAARDNKLQFKQVKSNGVDGLASLDGKYIKAPIYDAIFDVRDNWLDTTKVGTIYKYGILLPKATTQVLKTILSPLTHIRNFIGAGTFVSANGFPYGDLGQIGGRGIFDIAKSVSGKRIAPSIFGKFGLQDEELYRRLLRVGVIDSNVQANESKRIFKDIISDPSESKIMRKLLNFNEKVKNAFGKIQDAYVAEDDYFKSINWGIERNRYEKIFEKMEINKDNYLKLLTEESEKGKFLRSMAPRSDIASESYQSFLDEVAGNLTRNQVPNYNYIGRTGQALRQSPFGNFVAFPLEMMRTGNNIYTQAINEITIGKQLGSKELQGLGYRRLFGFGSTVAGIPLVVSEGFKAMHNVTDEELNALRRYVPEWSKNSTLIPTGRNDKGYLKYVDFSYTNPYDTLIKPFNAIVNEISKGKESKESLAKALGDGMISGMYDLLQPFTTESIFTEALVDSTLRRGVGRGGKRVWAEEDEGFVKVLKSINHLAETFKPGSWDQFVRLGRAATGKSDDYGKTFELKDEIHSLYGFRSIQSDPEDGLKYKITQFGSRLDKDRNLFSSTLLKGGRVTPEDIINNYTYSEARRFQTMKEMYLDIQAAKKLGVTTNVIEKKLKERKGMDKDTISNVMRGKYLPDTPNKFFVQKMQDINNDLNRKENKTIINPYFLALPTLNNLISNNKKLNLATDQIKVPKISLEEGVSEPQNILPAIVPSDTVTPIINNQTSSLPNQQVDRQQRYASLFPGDVLGEGIAANQQTKPVTLVG